METLKSLLTIIIHNTCICYISQRSTFTKRSFKYFHDSWFKFISVHLSIRLSEKIQSQKIHSIYANGPSVEHCPWFISRNSNLRIYFRIIVSTKYRFHKNNRLSYHLVQNFIAFEASSSLRNLKSRCSCNRCS